MSSLEEVLTMRKMTSVLTGPTATAPASTTTNNQTSKPSMPSRLLQAAKALKTRLSSSSSSSSSSPSQGKATSNAKPPASTNGTAATMTTPSTLRIKLQNATQSAQAYAYITGLDPTTGNKPILIQSDGRTPYRPASPAQILQPLAQNCAIYLGNPGASVTVTIPRIIGGRIWFSVGAPLTFLLNPGPALVEPSATNPADPNYDLYWSFAEFTFNEWELYANVSYVDFVCLPISLAVEGTGSGTRTVKALPADGLGRVVQKVEARGARWGKGVVRHPKTGAALRVLSPNLTGVLFPGTWDGYFQAYVDKVWDKYRGEDLLVDTQNAGWGVYRCRVEGAVLAAYSVNTGKKLGTFQKPTAADVWSCSTGPFAPPAGVTDGTAIAIYLNLGARISAAFNRGTMLVNSRQPQGEKAETYYQNEPCNLYSRACHEVSQRGYAFPYDDVAPSGGEDQSGFLRDGEPTLFTVTIGA